MRLLKDDTESYTPYSTPVIKPTTVVDTVIPTTPAPTTVPITPTPTQTVMPIGATTTNQTSVGTTPISIPSSIVKTSTPTTLAPTPIIKLPVNTTAVSGNSIGVQQQQTVSPAIKTNDVDPFAASATIQSVLQSAPTPTPRQPSHVVVSDPVDSSFPITDSQTISINNRAVPDMTATSAVSDLVTDSTQQTSTTTVEQQQQIPQWIWIAAIGLVVALFME